MLPFFSPLAQRTARFYQDKRFKRFIAAGVGVGTELLKREKIRKGEQLEKENLAMSKFHYLL